MMTLKLPNFGGTAPNCSCNLTNKNEGRMHYICTMLNRTNQMMEYIGLPETIPQRELELILQIYGHADFIEVDGKLYVFAGNLGGAPDPYYRSTFSVIANPALSLTGTYKIINHLEPAIEQNYTGECVVMRNDTQMIGLLPLFARYAAQLTENDISIRSAQISMRTHALITASTDRELKAAQQYLDELENGHIISVGEKAFLSGVRVQQHGVQSANTIIQLIELQQYLKAAWFNDMGLNANFNMKREYMSTEELQANTDVLLPLIDDMLQCRQEALDFVNERFGTNISVKKNSAWDRKQIELDTAQDKSEADVISELADTEADGQEASQVISEISEEQLERVEGDIVNDNTQEESQSDESNNAVRDAIVEAVADVIGQSVDESTEESTAEVTAAGEVEEKEDKEGDKK